MMLFVPFILQPCNKNLLTSLGSAPSQSTGAEETLAKKAQAMKPRNSE